MIQFLIGIFVGALLYYVFGERKKKPDFAGTFEIDLSDPMKDTCRLELDESLGEIYAKKEITLRVKTYANYTE